MLRQNGAHGDLAALGLRRDLHIHVEVGVILGVELLLQHPVPQFQAAEADDLLHGGGGDAGEARDVDDVGHPVHEGEARELAALGADAAVDIPDAVAHEGPAVEHGEHQLVALPLAHAVHEAGAGGIVRVPEVPARLLLRDELVEAGVREEDHAVALPGLGADHGGLGARRQLHGGDAPGPGEAVLIAAGVGPGVEEGLQAEDIPGEQGPLVPAAHVLAPEVADGVAQGDPVTPAGAAAPAEGLGDVVRDAADAEEDVHPAAHGHGEALFDALAEGEAGVVVGVRQPLKVDVLLKEGGHEARGVGQGGAAVEDAVPALEVKVPLPPGGAQHHGGHQVVAVGIQHPPGVGGQLDGAEAPSQVVWIQMAGSAQSISSRRARRVSA